MNAPMTIEQFLEYIYLDENGCWMWKKSTHEKRGGYGQKRIGPKLYKAHRLSWWVFNGYYPKSSEFVCHKCDNPRCCNPDHLFLGSPKDNVRDAWNKGRLPLPTNAPIGETHHSAKLTEKDVRNIRERLIKGEMQTVLAKDYGVTKQAIWRIKEGISWKSTW